MAETNEREIIERRIANLKADVNADFPGLPGTLEKGIQLVCITEPYPDFDFHPENLRRLGGMLMLSKHYGASVLFIDEDKFVELNKRNLQRRI